MSDVRKEFRYTWCCPRCGRMWASRREPDAPEICAVCRWKERRKDQ